MVADRSRLETWPYSFSFMRSRVIVVLTVVGLGLGAPQASATTCITLPTTAVYTNINCLGGANWSDSSSVCFPRSVTESVDGQTYPCTVPENETQYWSCPQVCNLAQGKHSLSYTFDLGQAGTETDPESDIYIETSSPTVTVQAPLETDVFPGNSTATITVSGAVAPGLAGVPMSYLYLDVANSEHPDVSTYTYDSGFTLVTLPVLYSAVGNITSWSFDVPGSLVPDNVVKVIAVDAARNSTTTLVTVNIDREPPDVYIALPDGATSFRQLSGISGTATDDFGLKEVRLTIQETGSGKYWDQDAQGFIASDDQIYYSIPVSGTSDDWSYDSISDSSMTAQTGYTITVTGVDKMGNESDPVETTLFFDVAQVLADAPADVADPGTVTFSQPNAVSYGQSTTLCATVPPKLLDQSYANLLVGQSPLAFAGETGAFDNVQWTGPLASADGQCGAGQVEVTLRVSDSECIPSEIVDATWFGTSVGAANVNIILPQSEMSQLTKENNLDTDVYNEYTLRFSGPPGLDLRGLQMTETVKFFTYKNYPPCIDSPGRAGPFLPAQYPDGEYQDDNGFKASFLGSPQKLLCGFVAVQQLWVGVHPPVPPSFSGRGCPFSPMGGTVVLDQRYGAKTKDKPFFGTLITTRSDTTTPITLVAP